MAGLNLIHKASAMSTEWYFARNGKQYGPHSAEEVRQFATDRKIRPEDLVWREGMTDWMPASSIRGLFAVPALMQPPARVEKAANEKYCHECGVAIRAKAVICPQCGVRQPSIANQSVSYESRVQANRAGLTTPVLISAIGNIAVGLFWFSTICGMPLGLAMFVLCIFEFRYYSNSDRLTAEEMVQRAGTLAICEICCGLFNLVSLVCGILLLINKGKYVRSLDEPQYDDQV